MGQGIGVWAFWGFVDSGFCGGGGKGLLLFDKIMVYGSSCRLCQILRVQGPK